MSNVNIATTRTTVNAAVIGAVVYCANRFFGVTIDPADPVILVAAPVVIGVGYRLSVYLADRFPQLAHILFGKTQTPDYEA